MFKEIKKKYIVRNESETHIICDKCGKDIGRYLNRLNYGKCFACRKHFCKKCNNTELIQFNMGYGHFSTSVCKDHKGLLVKLQTCRRLSIRLNKTLKEIENKYPEIDSYKTNNIL